MTDLVKTIEDDEEPEHLSDESASEDEVNFFLSKYFKGILKL